MNYNLKRREYHKSRMSVGLKNQLRFFSSTMSNTEHRRYSLMAFSPWSNTRIDDVNSINIVCSIQELTPKITYLCSELYLNTLSIIITFPIGSRVEIPYLIGLGF